ncbi:MAG: hypothetical protein ABIN37_14875 [Burkholderiaceae bacterium]
MPNLVDCLKAMKFEPTIRSRFGDGRWAVRKRNTMSATAELNIPKVSSLNSPACSEWRPHDAPASLAAGPV